MGGGRAAALSAVRRLLWLWCQQADLLLAAMQACVLGGKIVICGLSHVCLFFQDPAVGHCQICCKGDWHTDSVSQYMWQASALHTCNTEERQHVQRDC